MTLKIIFMGTPEFSIPSLQLLNSKYEIKSVYTQPPRKKSRGQKVIAKINSLSPFPGAWFKHNGKRIKILEAELSDNQGKIGEVLTDNLVVGCNDKSIKINLIQKEGKTVLDAKSFLTGYKIVKGEMLR